MPKKTPIHPLLADGIRAVAQVGARALGAAFDSVLEDVGAGADEVKARTSRARGRLDDIGVGRVRPGRTGTGRSRDAEEEPQAPRRSRSRKRPVGADEEDE